MPDSHPSLSLYIFGQSKDKSPNLIANYPNMNLKKAGILEFQL